MLYIEAELENDETSAAKRFFAKWKTHSSRLRNERDLGPRSSPYTSLPEVQLKGLPATERQKDIVDVGFMFKRNRLLAETGKVPSTSGITRDLWCDPSQGIQRKPWSNHPCCLTQATEMYSYEADAVLSGLGHLQLMGFPSDCAPTDLHTESAYRRLAGEVYSVPIMSLILTSIYLCPSMPWWREDAM